MLYTSLLIGLKPVILLSRDKEFIKISKQFVTALSPEEFLNTIE
jgi:hypothetical protein